MFSTSQCYIEIDEGPKTFSALIWKLRLLSWRNNVKVTLVPRYIGPRGKELGRPSGNEWDYYAFH